MRAPDADGNFVLVCGFVLDPWGKETDIDRIQEELLERLKESRERFLSGVDDLSGTFFIVYKDNGRYFILQDAAGMKPVHYCVDGQGERFVSSHEFLNKTFAKKGEDRFVKGIFDLAVSLGQASAYVPGVRTLTKDVLKLTSNTELCLNDLSVRRFYPRRPLRGAISFEEALETFSETLRVQANLLSSLNRTLRVAVTGGLDSRVSMAAFTDSGFANVKFFTYNNGRDLQSDTDAARALCARVGASHETFDLAEDRYPTGLLNIVPGLKHQSPLPVNPRVMAMYNECFDQSDILIDSYVAEIGQSFYRLSGQIPPDVPTAQNMSQLWSLKVWNNPDSIALMGEYIKKTGFKNVEGYDWRDLFYWEHRNPKWASVRASECEMSVDVCIPYNNRRLLEVALRLPLETRRSSELWRRTVDVLAPALSSAELV